MAVPPSVNAGVPASGGDRAGGAPQAPRPSKSLPLVVLWVVPFLLVILYMLLVHEFFHGQARWTDVPDAPVPPR